MRISFLYCAPLLCALALAALYRPQWLFSSWMVSLLVFPTTQALAGGAPIYMYDLLNVFVVLTLLRQGDLRSWPAGLPRWHWWFIGSAFVLSVVGGFFIYGFHLEILWIWGHSSLSWMPFAFGVLIPTSPFRSTYEIGLRRGILLSVVILCGIAIIQYLDLPLATKINKLFYGAIGAEASVETLLRGNETNRAMGPHFAPTGLAGVTLLTAIIFWLVTEQESVWPRLLVTTLCLITILCTVSRHVLVATAVGMIVMIILSDARTRSRLILVTCIACLIGAAGAGVTLKKSWGSRLGKWDRGVMQDENITARVVDGPQRLAEYFALNPGTLLTGAGLDPEKLESKSGIKSSLRSGFVSNGFLLALYYLGIGGFVLYLLFWVWAFRISLKHPPPVRGIMCGFVAMATVIVAADNYSFMYEVAAALLFLIVGLIAGRYFDVLAEEELILEPLIEAQAIKFAHGN